MQMTGVRQAFWPMAACALTAMVVVAVLWQPTLGLGGIAAVGLVAIAAASPAAGAIIWVAVVVMVPFWTFGLTITPGFISLPIAVGLLLRRFGDSVNGKSSTSGGLAAIDVFIGAGVVLAVISQQVFGQAAFLTSNVVVTLFGGYLVGRIVRQSASRTFAIAIIVVAVWGIVEFVTGWHAFVNLNASVGGLGPALQERGGVTRSEATLGHAIAYGAALAAAVPLVAQLKRPLIWQLILIGGVLASVSRGPIIAAVFAFAMMAWVSRSTRVRVWSSILLVAGLIGIYFVFTLLYEGAGQSDVTLSQEARDQQLWQTLSFANWFGPATGMQMDLEGNYVVNGIARVDSAPLRLALDYGFIIAALLLTPFVFASFAVLFRKAGPATVALASQIPVVFVTSYITQWQTIIYFLAGLAVTEYLDAKREAASSEDRTWRPTARQRAQSTRQRARMSAAN
ncbi:MULTISPECIES: hypothetical protein [unclassified Microbacterium]|uniref:hypothetical protein n=1 Tax=unclassified Microbacterium TaxID=2609290 RepID=UPI00386B9552